MLMNLMFSGYLNLYKGLIREKSCLITLSFNIYLNLYKGLILDACEQIVEEVVYLNLYKGLIPV